MTPKPRTGSRRSPDNTQFTVVLHKKFREHLEENMSKDENLSEVVRAYLADRYKYTGEKIAGRRADTV